MWNDIFSIILIEAFKGQVDWLKKIEKRLQGFFLWIWFNWLKATKPLQGGSLFLTTKVCHTCEGHNLHNTEALWLLRKLLFFNWSLTGSPPPPKKKKKKKKKADERWVLFDYLPIPDILYYFGWNRIELCIFSSH